MNDTSIYDEIADIYGYVSCSYNEGNPAELMDRLTNLNVYLARTADLLAEAERLWNIEKGNVAHRNPDETATRLRYIIEAETANEAKFYRQVERLNAAIVHQIEAIRTQVSFVKMQMQNGV